MLRLLCGLRAFFFIIVFPIFTVVLSGILFIGLLLGGGRRFADFIVCSWWARWLVFMVGVKVHVKGAEHVPRDRGFLYLFTHSSDFDIPILYGWCPKTFRFGAKAELFKIPIFGRAMRAVGTLPIARGDRESVIKVYQEAESRVADGEAFALAPEGGRRKSKELAPFKTGPFIFAVNANMPLVPAILSGMDEVLPNGGVFPSLKTWRPVVVLRFLPPYDVADYTSETAKVLKEKVRGDMVEAFRGDTERFDF